MGAGMRTSRVAVVSAVAAVLATLMVASAAWAGASHRTVQILDDCDAETFDAVLGEGACVKHGDVTFDELVDQLITMGEAPAWRFAPGQLKLDTGATITASNRGGEFHTFSEVAAFGGGCVPEINELLGLDPVPECEIPDIFMTTGVPPRGSLTTAPLAAGTHRFQCLIHPWQRTTAQAR
jgi:plastocyanin